VGDYIKMKAEKHGVPVIAFVESVGTSGGFMLACVAEQIYIDPYGKVGSIGIIGPGPKKKEDVKIKTDNLEDKQQSEGAQTDDRNKIDNEPNLEQANVDHCHQIFINQVKDSRGPRLKGDDELLFNGGTWTGGMAEELGLVDGCQTMDRWLEERYGGRVKLVVAKSSETTKRDPEAQQLLVLQQQLQGMQQQLQGIQQQHQLQHSQQHLQHGQLEVTRQHLQVMQTHLQISQKQQKEQQQHQLQQRKLEEQKMEDHKLQQHKQPEHTKQQELQQEEQQQKKQDKQRLQLDEQQQATKPAFTPDAKRVVVWARRENEDIFSPLPLEPPTMPSLAKAIETKYNVSAAAMRQGKQGTPRRDIIAKLDDDLLKFCDNAKVFPLHITEVMSVTEEGQETVVYAIIFNETVKSEGGKEQVVS
jgi:ClpP class serine protease